MEKLKEPKQFLIQGDVFEVEKLVGIKLVKGQILYRVRWRGYGKESDTYEPEENLLSCKDMILELEEKMMERRKGKPEFMNHTMAATTSFDDFDKFAVATWQASEVDPCSNSKDTFWRDFDEGKIRIPDKDMYSKVKERASRTVPGTDCIKSLEPRPVENPIDYPLCPKVVLKRKPCSKSTESLTYRSSLKKPGSLCPRKRKKYDILRDYRRRKSRIHRKRSASENHRNKMAYRICEQLETCHSENGGNILQELLISDGIQSPVKKFYGSKVNSDENLISTVPKSREIPRKPKDYCFKEVVKKNPSLTCRIAIHDKLKGLYSSCKLKGKTDSSCKAKSSFSSMLDYGTKKAFYALLEAVANEELGAVEKFSSNPYLINCVKDDGTTALMLVAKLGLYYVAKILLKANAHKDKQNRRGETALMIASRNNHPKVARLLLEYGANFAVTNADGINVLRITNQCASKSVLHNILVEHIMRIVSEFEGQARSAIQHVAEIKYALFPIQCFSVNEGPKYFINFHHHVKLESPGKTGKQNLIFIANSIIKGNSIQCGFDAECLICHVYINGVKQELFNKGEYSVYKMSGLQNGNNRISIIIQHYPESQVKLIVCAYRVHRSMAWFPAQKLKCDFMD